MSRGPRPADTSPSVEALKERLLQAEAEADRLRTLLEVEQWGASELQVRVERLRSIVDTSSLLIGCVSVEPGDLRLVALNRACAALLGGQPGDLEGKLLVGDGVLGREQAALFIDKFKEAVSRTTVTRLEYEAPTERPRLYAATLAPVPAPGAAVHCGFVIEDVTERRELERRLRLADRLFSVGTLAAGVAHEINNPLAFLSANLDFAVDALGKGADEVAEVVQALSEAREGAERVRRIVRDMKLLSKPEEERVERVQVIPLLEQCVKIAWNEIRHRARLDRELEPVPDVESNSSRLGQVFVNLLVNAAQAIPDGRPDGVVTIRSRTVDDGRRVLIEVGDTGVGIPPEIRSRIFDPFFSTKGPGQNSGLGLSIVHGIVHALGGEIGLETEVGRGTTFRVLLPATADAADDGETRRVLPEAAGRILLVDDEALIGPAVRRLLSEAEVVVAGTAQEALRRVEAGESFDAILCDVMMPHAGGPDLWQTLIRRYPALAARTVFMTAGAFSTQARAFVESTTQPLIEKPFSVERLREALAQVMKPAKKKR